MSYKGCFKDELVLRDLEVTAWKENEENSVLKCIMRCYDYGYKYAGLQVGLGMQRGSAFNFKIIFKYIFKLIGSNHICIRFSGGSRISLGTNLLFGQIFLENFMKMKEMRLRGRGVPVAHSWIHQCICPMCLLQ